MPPDQLNSRRLPADFNRQYHALAGLDTRGLLSWVFAPHKPFGEVGVVTSFGAESAVLLHLIADVAPAAPVILSILVFILTKRWPIGMSSRISWGFGP